MVYVMKVVCVEVHQVIYKGFDTVHGVSLLSVSDEAILHHIRADYAPDGRKKQTVFAR
jgi:hypothetical protein